MPYRYAFFDLDGTITYSSPGILNSVRYALNKMGAEIPAEDKLVGFIGPPLLWGFSHICGMSEEDSHRVVAAYREYYAVKGMLECHVFEGVPELIHTLHDHGIPCVLATCKPHIYAGPILAHFGLDRYFAFVSGPELDGTRNEKHEVIDYAMRHLGITNPKSILMIGDRDNDVLGARHHGMDCAGVLWGFGSREELEGCGARYLVNTPHELEKLFVD